MDDVCKGLFFISEDGFLAYKYHKGALFFKETTLELESRVIREVRCFGNSNSNNSSNFRNEIAQAIAFLFNINHPLRNWVMPYNMCNGDLSVDGYGCQINCLFGWTTIAKREGWQYDWPSLRHHRVSGKYCDLTEKFFLDNPRMDNISEPRCGPFCVRESIVI